MKIIIYSCFFFFIPGLMCFAQITAEELLLKALAAQGRNHYKEVKSIAYRKKINYFDASGTVLDTVIENHTIDFVNSTSQFSWKEQGNDFIAIQNKDSVTLQINGVNTRDTSTILKKKFKGSDLCFLAAFQIGRS